MDYKEPEWLAEKLGLDKNTVYRFLQEGTIPAVQLGRKWLVSEARVEQWLREEMDRQTTARREALRCSERLIRRLDNFTTGARQALKRAHTEARRYAHGRIDTSHLLLGLALDAKSVASKVIRALGITPDEVRREVETKLEAGDQPAPRRLGRTAEAKKAIRLATRLAIRQSPKKAIAPVGSDHLLMGILLARRGLGHDILVGHSVTRQRLREALAASRKTSSGDKHES